MSDAPSKTNPPACADCLHYGNFRPCGGGTPPWPVCRYDERPETCRHYVTDTRTRLTWDDAA